PSPLLGMVGEVHRVELTGHTIRVSVAFGDRADNGFWTFDPAHLERPDWPVNADRPSPADAGDFLSAVIGGFLSAVAKERLWAADRDDPQAMGGWSHVLLMQ